jgi:GGDEF domain-containing protein
MFLPEVTVDMVAEIVQRIRNPKVCYQISPAGNCLCLSVGWAVSNSQGADIYDLFKEADEHMYRDKLANKSKKLGR